MKYVHSIKLILSSDRNHFYFQGHKALYKYTMVKSRRSQEFIKLLIDEI